MTTLGRARALVATLVLCTQAVLTAPASSQAYPQLHVIALSQRVDRATVEPGGVFHLTIHVRIAQRRDRIDELILGTFDNCEIISNETVRTALPSGTDFVERLAVQALQPGVATISPAYIDADDPALRRPMRFSSNAVRVTVGAGNALGGAFDGFADKARRLLLAAAIVAGFCAAAFVVFVIFALFARRRRRPAAVVPSAPPVPSVVVPAPPAAADERLAAVARAYRDARTPVALLAVRGVLFELAGAPAGATLVDALRALSAREPDLRAALVAAEASAFGPASMRAAAGDEMLAAIAAYAARGAAKADAWTS